MHPAATATATVGRSTAGFTLVEMLVVVVILLVLMGVSVSVINVSLNGERVRSGARQVQSYLMGARDRAVYRQLPCGVRFELDPNSAPTRPLVLSMVYIGASQNWSQGSLTVHRNPNNHNLPELVRGEFAEWFSLRFGEDINKNNSLDPGEDRNGNGRLDFGPLVDGARIKLGSRWYTITSTALLTVSDEWLVISPPLVDPHPVDEPYPAIPLRPIASRYDEGDYELTLMPRALPNTQPVQLPPGVVIDLGYSHLPSSLWLATNYVYRDIMFSPRGSVIGTAAAAGVIHLLLNDVSDITRNLTPWHVGNLEEKRIVSLFTRTGNVTSNEPFPGETVVGADIDRNGTIDQPGPRNLFYYAERGEVSE
ncbi:MAG: prepilin-type N-terminal cleavage/methylation domain-containing protein [Planctomycetaceae bacterium]|jgi:prepilin-type N-terminal cleavage/methylation domain-containing protein|nr:prepilin-type N-terminal cleavage/methylation domain-containing protein [Planctomycetaceae bacterium]